MEMKKYKLGDIADINKQTLSKKDSMDIIEYLDTGSLTENIFGQKQVLSREEAPSRAQRRVFDKTILYSTVRPRLKHYGFLESPKENTIVSTGFATIDVKDEFKNVIDAYYLYLLLIQDKITEYLGTIADTAVSAYPSLNPSDIQSLEFEFPDMPIQKKIASFLCNIDKRIENLRAQNRVLERTAKTIYDYTFLQCAGRKTVYNKTLKRNIPEGWDVKNIFEVFDIKYGFPFSTELFTEEKTDKPIVRIRDILEHTTSAYTTEDVDEKYRLQEGDLVIGMDGNFHMNLWTDNNSYLNQRCVRIRMNDNNVTSVQAKFALAPYIKAKEMTAKGSTVGHLSDKDLKGIFILMPNKKTLEKFNALILPLFQKQLVNTKQIKALTSQRNTLLPLLMNGQVEV